MTFLPYMHYFEGLSDILQICIEINVKFVLVSVITCRFIDFRELIVQTVARLCKFERVGLARNTVTLFPNLETAPRHKP